MHRIGILAALVGLLAVAGAVSAQGVGDACNLLSQHADAACAASADPTAGAYSGAASAAHDEAAAAADAAAGHTDVETAKKGGFFAWLSVNFSAFVAKLGDAFGLAGESAPALDGAADVKLGTEGVGADVNAAGASASASATTDGARVDAANEHGSVSLEGTLGGVLG